jgi:hypothetical protein
MDEESNQEPRERFRNILSSPEEEAILPPELEMELQPQSQPKSESLIDRLPHLNPSPQAPPTGEVEEASPKSKTPLFQKLSSKLPQRKQSVQVEPQPPEEPEKAVKPQGMRRREKFLRALWTITSLISMAVNIVAIIVIIVLIWAYRNIKVPESIDVTMVNKLLDGLYSNFERLDQATIRTTIPVDAQIPLDISVPVQTTTQITLADSVVIPNAQVVINTGGLNINSNARVTLPAGTPLTVNLNFNLPVQTSIPVHLDVPVNIPMSETELHAPFVGLQDVVQPLYCLVDQNATNLEEQLICR